MTSHNPYPNNEPMKGKDSDGSISDKQDKLDPMVELVNSLNALVDDINDNISATSRDTLKEIGARINSLSAESDTKNDATARSPIFLSPMPDTPDINMLMKNLEFNPQVKQPERESPSIESSESLSLS